MKLNTKKTEGVCKELKKAKQSFKKSMQCALICSSGAGEKITEHFIGCPYFVATEKPMDREHIYEWGYKNGRTIATAEYKQKLIKRIEGMKHIIPFPEALEKYDRQSKLLAEGFNQALDEVEAVIKEV